MGGIEAVSVRRHDSSEGMIKTTIKARLSSLELDCPPSAAGSTGRRRTRKHYSAEEKIRIVLRD